MFHPNVRGAAVPPGTPSGTLFVSVSQTWQANNPVVPQNVSLEDCARGYWWIRNLQAAWYTQCEYLMAHRDGVIVGAWRIDLVKGWMQPMQTPKATWPTDCHQHPTPSRKRGCELIADEELNRFVGQPVCMGTCPNPLRGYFIP